MREYASSLPTPIATMFPCTCRWSPLVKCDRVSRSFGIAVTNHRRACWNAGSRVIDRFEDAILSFDQETAEIWGRLRVPNRENPLDKQIAATTIINELTVVTRNIAHYAPTGVGLLNPFSGS